MDRDRVLIVPESAGTGQRLRAYLRETQAELRAEVHETSKNLAERVREYTPTVLVLGYRYARGPTGAELCARLRRSPETRHIGILVVTRHLDPGEERRVLLHGADLCLLDRFVTAESLGENVARLVEHVRERSQTVLRLGPLTVDTVAREATLHDRRLELDPMDFDVLHRLASRPGHTFSHAELLGFARIAPAGKEQTLARVRAYNIRRAFGPERALLQTVPKRGYRLEVALS